MNCARCGLFCGYATMDEYTNWGHSGDTEPPDPVCVCARCSKAEEDRLVRETVRPNRFSTPWRPARYHRNAAKRLGMVWAGPRMAAWSSVYWPDAIPEGEEIRQERT